MANEFSNSVAGNLAPFKYLGIDIFSSAGTPTASGPIKGALCVDTTNAILYINTGTVASATWAPFDSSTIALTNIVAADGAAIPDSNGNEWLEADIVASAVNHVKILNAATGGAPSVAAVGGDTDIGLIVAGKGGAPVVLRSVTITQQGAATAKTVSSTLSADELYGGIITVNQGAGATSAQQLPLASGMDSLSALFATSDAVNFSVINTSTVDAEDASITTNTGWTLVGNMDIPAYSAAGSLNSSASFRARKTGTATWTLFRLS